MSILVVSSIGKFYFFRRNKRYFKNIKRFYKTACSTDGTISQSALLSCCKPRSSALGSRAVTRHNKPKVRKKIRRGKRSNAKRNGKQGVHGHPGVSCKFLYVSIRGFKSKADSLYQLIQEQDIDLLLLAETKVYTNTAINIKGFQSFPVVMDRNTGGGLCICIRHGLLKSVMTDSGNKAEFITVRLNGNTNNDHIRIILAYSPQENDIQGVIDFYQNLSVQIERAHLNEDNVILVGDVNAKLGSEIIAGYPYPMSSSGKLLYEFYTKYNLHLLNASDVCTGVLTRIQHCKGKIEKSTIDYLFVSAGLVSGVISVQIDEEKVITPWRVVRGGQ